MKGPPGFSAVLAATREIGDEKTRDAMLGWLESWVASGRQDIETLFGLPDFDTSGCWAVVKPYFGSARQCRRDDLRPVGGFPFINACRAHRGQWDILRSAVGELERHRETQRRQDSAPRTPNTEALEPASVYVMALHDRRKIGVSGDIDRRASDISRTAGARVGVVHVEEYSDRRLALAREKELHKRFAEARLVGEWFRAASVDAWLEVVGQERAA